MHQRKFGPFGSRILSMILLAALLLSCAGCGSGSEEPEENKIAAGVTYLQQLEAASPQMVDEVLKQQQAQERQEKREERLAQLESGEVSVWTLFEDYVLLGDSRAVGFSYYGFLPENRVLAEGGATIRDLENHIPDFAPMNPASLFLCYGLNDVSIGYWETPEAYTAEFRKIIGEVQKELPQVKIYISSILPARDPAFAQAEAWRDIPMYSAVVKTMCEDIHNCFYVDNDALAEQYAELWDDDGIHVREDFYPHWACNMIVEVYEGENSEDIVS